MSKWEFSDIPDQSGRTAVVTGANSGIGLVAARELARAGATVVLAARSEKKAEGAAEKIAEAGAAGETVPAVLDLADLASVREFAARVASEHPKLDLLLNNAGVMMTPKRKTEDGFELQFGTNHLGHFALTGSLIDNLRAATGARVVTVSSIEHKPGKIDFEDIPLDDGYSPRSAYQRSKLSNAMFGIELDRRLRAAGSDVRSILAHPGYSNTNLQHAGPSGVVSLAFRVINPLFAQSADRGALPTLFAATSPDAHGGDFIGPDGFQEFRGHPTKVQATALANDEMFGAQLWEVSEEMTGVSFLSAATAAG